MTKNYIVKHEYQVDGGFGDAVDCEDIVAIFNNKDDADLFVVRFSNSRIYDKPYDFLYYGELTVEEEDVITHEEFSSYMESLDKENLPWESFFKEQEEWYKERCARRLES